MAEFLPGPPRFSAPYGDSGARNLFGVPPADPPPCSIEDIDLPNRVGVEQPLLLSLDDLAAGEGEAGSRAELIDRERACPIFAMGVATTEAREVTRDIVLDLLMSGASASVTSREARETLSASWPLAAASSSPASSFSGFSETTESLPLGTPLRLRFR